MSLANRSEVMSVRMQLSIVACAMAMALTGCGSKDAAEPAPAGAARSQPAAAAAGSVPAMLRSTIAATLKVDEGKVTPRASFAGDLGADELAMVELVMAYERTFKVDISNADADRFKQVQDVMAYLEQRRALR